MEPLSVCLVRQALLQGTVSKAMVRLRKATFWLCPVERVTWELNDLNLLALSNG